MECTNLAEAVRGLALRIIKTIVGAELVDIDGGKSRHPPRMAMVLDAGERCGSLVVAYTEAAIVRRIL